LLMRVTIGWQFLYEGYVKITSTGWSAAGYLNAAPGPFSGMFEYMVDHAWMLKSIDAVMLYGLSAIGLCLILGFFTRTAAVGAALLLLLFYISNPPFIGVQFMPGEGSYLIVNKNLMEFTAAMVLVAFPSGLFWGLDRLFVKE
ncbi:MAG: DoxX family membrane protein, partial [Candidatus Glassbacteria bacterium]|nr:DoxX family membrane protein [Candidatus Glassbacteria bacterium]